MRRSARGLLVGLLALLIPLGLRAQSKVSSVEKVSDGIWMARTDAGSNVGWFLLGEEVVVIDAGSDAATGKALLEKIQETAGKAARYLVITHAHGDHAGGLAPFVAAGAQVICQENAAPGVARLVSASSRSKGSVLAFSDRFAFLGGPRRAALYFLGPAHTAGDLVVYLPEDKVLFSGDVALSGRAPDMQSPDVDPKEWEKMLGHLAQLNVEKVVPGHGTLGTRKAIADTFAYVKMINELAKTLIDEKVPEDLIEARLRKAGSGIEPSMITPDLLANVRSVMRADKASRAARPTPKPAKPPARKSG